MLHTGHLLIKAVGGAPSLFGFPVPSVRKQGWSTSSHALCLLTFCQGPSTGTLPTERFMMLAANCEVHHTQALHFLFPTNLACLQMGHCCCRTFTSPCFLVAQDECNFARSWEAAFAPISKSAETRHLNMPGESCGFQCPPVISRFQWSVWGNHGRMIDHHVFFYMSVQILVSGTRCNGVNFFFLFFYFLQYETMETNWNETLETKQISFQAHFCFP